MVEGEKGAELTRCSFLSGGAAFIFFLVVSVSTSVADSLYFARYTFSGQRDLRLGIWGYCTYDVSSAGALLNKECVRKLGWNVPLFNGFPNYINSNESYPYVGGNLLKARSSRKALRRANTS